MSTSIHFDDGTYLSFPKVMHIIKKENKLRAFININNDQYLFLLMERGANKIYTLKLERAKYYMERIEQIKKFAQDSMDWEK